MRQERSVQVEPEHYLQRQYRVAKMRGYNQAVRHLRELAPFARDPEQVIQCCELLASIGPDLHDRG